MRRCGGVEVWRPGGVLQACRRGDVEVCRSGAREACCMCRDVEEAQRFGAVEMRCRRVDVEIVEVWSFGGILRV